MKPGEYKDQTGGSLLRAVKILTAAFILIMTFLGRLPAGAKTYSYWAVRELIKGYTVLSAWNMDKLTSEHFYVKFRPEDRQGAELVLATAEMFYRPVTGDFGYVPAARIPLILYSSKEELNGSFGWDAKQSAIGVYWGGAIRVLTPEVWIEEKDPARLKETFATSGPMAHELTHLMVDYLTGGNYPRWFTEGVAQYEENKITGFEFSDIYGSPGQQFYSMQDLSQNFDSLPDQYLAYREAYSAVRYIVDQYGEKTLFNLIKELGDGKNFDQALLKSLQIDSTGFEANWRAWARQGG
ncbi:peptidase MA family metallohydrolase [Pelotomaculum propionicicum]|uniref:Peptidase MA-like domain-containing protein n=1 Tax=Pelotomaculum propionicicum TaxID=258475 RepID=A0A4Y7RXV4_9FIRM|nr:peptidase MA family metallohydrolase [Pelotomaculum propionicicum]NLI11459.1 hypothetical protein [Peptococcaceae bacterium]TEB13673.1 hypothetical protein Pmgp_00073 [Pelotomaculum propionicicum]